jgi:hypothetical protein
MRRSAPLADVLFEWIPDVKMREPVLVRNPETFFGFS